MQTTPREARRTHELVLPIAIAAAFLLWVFCTQSLRSPIPDHGDWWSDMVLMVAGRNMHSLGKLCYGVVLDGGHEVGLPPFYYTHFPSFPTVTLATFNFLGIPIYGARLFTLLLSSSGLVALYLMVRQMTPDRRVALAAMLALAVSASFRALSDNVIYVPHATAVKLWTLFFLAAACRATGRARLGYIIAAGVATYLAFILVGWEGLPSVCVSAVLFPFVARGRAGWRLALACGFSLATAVVLGAVTRLLHNACMVGSLANVIADLRAAMNYRAGNWQYIQFWGRSFPAEIKYRVMSYHPFHCLLMAQGALVCGVLTILRRYAPEWRMLGFLAAILAGESVWFILMREHSHRHVHTILLLAGSLSVATALAAIGLYDLVRTARPARMIAWALGVALLVAALSNARVKPYGNVELKMDWSWFQAVMKPLADAIPPQGVVVIDLPQGDPTPEFFMDRTFVRRVPTMLLFDKIPRYYVLTFSDPKSAGYQRAAVVGGKLLAVSNRFAVFVMTFPQL